jgi:hypothetical protein
MAKLALSGWGGSAETSDDYPHKLSSPMAFFWTMVIFLIIVGFVAAILFRQAQAAFLSNPGLNGLILGVLLIGILLVFNHVLALRPEVRWFNSFRAAGSAEKVGRDPVLLAPMRALIGRHHSVALSTATLRSILDSIATRLDESRDTSRYLIGLLVFLGLLGTFWGLIETVGSIGGVIGSLKVTGDAGSLFDTLKEGLAAPLGGMGISFSSSLFGLAGSLILGFLDLQSSQAQNRFYTDLEDWLASTVRSSAGDSALAGSADLQAALERLRLTLEDGGANRATTAAMANLANAIQSLVAHMRNEQQMIREWADAQGEQNREIKELLSALVQRPEKSLREPEKS